MITGLGTDIIEIDRIGKIIDRFGHKFLKRIFSPSEQQYCYKYRLSTERFAGRFAAKEAIVKALGTGIRDQLSWIDVEILNNEQGKPEVYLSPHIRELFQDPLIHVSISHSKKYAIAFAVLEKRSAND